MRRIVCFVTCGLLLAVSPLALQAQDKASSTDMQILRDKIKADKKLLVADNLQLTDKEAKGFWPIYDAYQKDLQKINEHLGKTIEQYAEGYNKDSLTDADAKKLISEAIGVEESEVKLHRTYLGKLEKVLPGKKVARYLQIETKIRALIRFELAAQIPLVE